MRYSITKEWFNEYLQVGHYEMLRRDSDKVNAMLKWMFGHNFTLDRYAEDVKRCFRRNPGVPIKLWRLTS